MRCPVCIGHRRAEFAACTCMSARTAVISLPWEAETKSIAFPLSIKRALAAFLALPAANLIIRFCWVDNTSLVTGCPNSFLHLAGPRISGKLLRRRRPQRSLLLADAHNLDSDSEHDRDAAAHRSTPHEAVPSRGTLHGEAALSRPSDCLVAPLDSVGRPFSAPSLILALCNSIARATGRPRAG